MYHPRSSRPLRGTLLATAAALLCGGSGCTAVDHYFHHHSPVAAGEPHHHNGYFHCPDCGRIVPKGKKHACHHTGGVVLPCFGFEPTCWRPWPAGCIGCPEVCAPEGFEDVEIIEETILDDHRFAPEPEQAPPIPSAPAAGHHSAAPARGLMKTASDRQPTAEPAASASAAGGPAARRGAPRTPDAQPLRSVVPASSTEEAPATGDTFAADDAFSSARPFSAGDEQAPAAGEPLFPALHFADPSMWASE